ncbi:sensor histidine kinase [bacterium]|nr:sensor histidine kinase [bacterium]
MAHTGSWATVGRGEGAHDLAADTDRLFVDRVRLGLWLVNAGIAAVFVGWLLVNGTSRPLLSGIQALNFLVVAAALRLLRDPERRTLNHVVAFVAYAVTIVSTAGVGIVAGDGTTPLLILVGMSVIAAVLVPWRPAWHLAGMALTVAAAVWTVATVATQPLLWLRNAGAIAPTLIAAVYLSRTLSRQRAEAVRAARELRDANRRLEREIEERRKTETALRFAMRELDHRVNNTLATVQSVAEQTLRSSPSMSAFAPAFAGRIQALARIHGALAARRWDGLTVGELVELLVEPHRRPGASVRVDSPDGFVPGELVRALGMALHELATNAARYGALSAAGGEVVVAARVRADGDARLRIHWRERGGPPVGEPARRGFGTRLIEEALAYDTQGRASLGFAAEGVRCDIELPIPPPS